MARELPDTNLPWPIPLEAVGLIADAEKLSLVAYQCPAGVWTIGWGETEGVKPGDTCTKEQADNWLLEDLTDRCKAIRDMCVTEPNPNQLGALVSLAYNIGLEGLKKSTALRKHNEGDYDAAARAFGLWNKAKNPATGQLQVLRGLTARRAAESALYLKMPDNMPDWLRDPMPQEIAPESSMVKSPVAQGSTITAGTGTVLAAGAAFADQLSPVIDKAKSFADTLHLSPLYVLAGIMIVVGLVGLYNRYKQRDQGWA